MSRARLWSSTWNHFTLRFLLYHQKMRNLCRKSFWKTLHFLCRCSWSGFRPSQPSLPSIKGRFVGTSFNGKENTDLFVGWPPQVYLWSKLLSRYLAEVKCMEHPNQDISADFQWDIFLTTRGGRGMNQCCSYWKVPFAALPNRKRAGLGRSVETANWSRFTNLVRSALPADCTLSSWDLTCFE